ncbi:MAG: hypothetical protein IPG50_36230 [Myxococcales bacterium]|nr:hypothetical protein [Myxococcales bacterium]
MARRRVRRPEAFRARPRVAHTAKAFEGVDGDDLALLIQEGSIAAARELVA